MSLKKVGYHSVNNHDKVAAFNQGGKIALLLCFVMSKKTSSVLPRAKLSCLSCLSEGSCLVFYFAKSKRLIGDQTTRLELASGGDGGGSTTATDGTGAGTASLDGLDDGHGSSVTVGDLAEDDVTAVEPAGDDGGDEELRAVAV